MPTLNQTVQKYQKRPVVIEAVQWDGTAEGATPIINWVLNNGGTARYTCVHPEKCSVHSEDARDIGSHVILIDTLEGTVAASPDDWILRGLAGEFYPCKSDIFDVTYERVADDDAVLVRQVQGEEAP